MALAHSRPRQGGSLFRFLLGTEIKSSSENLKFSVAAVRNCTFDPIFFICGME